MSEYMILAYVLVGVLVFLVMCFGVVLIMTAFDIIRNSYKEVQEDDPFREDQIAE
jgi:hypothetical protein